MNIFINIFNISHLPYTFTTQYVRLDHGKKSIKLLSKVGLKIVSIRVWKKKSWLRCRNAIISKQNEDSVVRKRKKPRK